MTDLHLSARMPVSGRQPDTVAVLSRAVQAIRAMRPAPDFVAISGDLTDAGDPDSYALLRDMLAEMPAPVHLALGNHDRRGPFHQVFGSPGADHAWSQDVLHGSLHVITLDTLVPGQVAGALDPGQLDFLQRALDRYPGRDKLLVLHHPPRMADTDLPWTSLDVESTEALRRALAGYPVAGILSGHVHINRVSHWYGVPVFISIGHHSTVDLLERARMRIVEGSGFGFGIWRPSGISMAFVPLSGNARELRSVDTTRLRRRAAKQTTVPGGGKDGE